MIQAILWHFIKFLYKSIKEGRQVTTTPIVTAPIVKEQNDGLVEFIIGLILGIAGGGLLALLFAPKSGAETQKNVQNFVTKLPNQVRDEFQNPDAKTRMFLDRTKVNIENQVDKVKGNIEANKMVEAKKREEKASGEYEYN